MDASQGKEDDHVLHDVAWTPDLLRMTNGMMRLKSEGSRTRSPLKPKPGLSGPPVAITS
jgi:hypothetical protein